MATKKRKIHRVKAAAAVVPLGGTDRYLYRGARVPDGVEDKHLKRLVSVGLLEVVEVDVEETGGEGGTPSGPTKPAANAGFDKQLDWANHLGIEVPADAVESKDKDKVKALIEAHEKAASASGGSN
ncbi:hypothetical protein ACIOWF_06770 [Cellulosimicrobium cellulans]|uniref:hypothetical protein n=1 Tax=Cellulosimicrobium cellulans TaxID=1710 RepID=UPI0037F7B46D